MVPLLLPAFPPSLFIREDIRLSDQTMRRGRGGGYTDRAEISSIR